MSFTVEKLEHSMAKLTITVPAADFDSSLQQDKEQIQCSRLP